MPQEEHFRKLERMYAAAPCNEYFRPRMTISQGRAEVTIKIRPDFFHTAGATHGSVYFKALDDACFFAVNSLVEDVFVLTASFNTYLVRPISSGEMKSVGRVVHASATLFTAEALLYDSRDKEIGRGSGNFVRSKISLRPETGYK